MCTQCTQCGWLGSAKGQKSTQTRLLPSIAVHSMWSVLLEGGYPTGCVHMFEGCMLVLLVLWGARWACWDFPRFLYRAHMNPHMTIGGGNHLLRSPSPPPRPHATPSCSTSSSGSPKPQDYGQVLCRRRSMLVAEDLVVNTTSSQWDNLHSLQRCTWFRMGLAMVWPVCMDDVWHTEGQVLPTLSTS